MAVISGDMLQLLSQALRSSIDSEISLNPPKDFAMQVRCAKEMTKNDLTGSVATIIDFMINSICDIDFTIETNNQATTDILNKWLKNINKDYGNTIPVGLKTIQKEYLTERWQSGLIVTQATWKTFEQYSLPINLMIYDSEFINVSGDTIDNFVYKNKEKELKKDIYIQKLGRILEAYPTPYLIRKVYGNWALKGWLKSKGSELLKEALIYLILMKKGHPSRPDIAYSSDDYTKMATDLKSVVSTAKEEGRAPFHITGFDTEFENIIPDLAKVFSQGIYEELDRDILAGMGMIDIVQGLSSTRRESVLNPKPMIAEIEQGIAGFKLLLTSLVNDIIDKNKSSYPKYFGDSALKNFRIVNTPLKSFWTDDFLTLVRSMYDRGLVDYQTYIEAHGFDFGTVLKRKQTDAKNGYEVVMYPPIILNREESISPIEEEKMAPDNTPEEPVDETKQNPVDKQNFKSTEELTGAPYESISEIPARIKNLFADEKLLDAFRKAFNGAWNTYSDYDTSMRETISFKVAWKQIKLMGYKSKDNKWHLKDKYKANPIKANEALLEGALKLQDKKIYV